MAYAEVKDVEGGFRALSKDEQSRCAALLAEAAVIIDAGHPERLSGLCQAELHDKSNVCCISNYAVCVCELYQRCEIETVAGNGRLKQSC